MATIISSSELQKNIGKLVRGIDSNSFIVINRGKARMVILPYYDDNEEKIKEYLESYEMHRNRVSLQGKWQRSLDGGLSDLSV
jgi:hypothetical protein